MAKAPHTKRKFQSLSEGDIKKIDVKCRRTEHQKANQQAVKLIKKLTENQQGPDFKKYNVETLDKTRTKFYAEIQSHRCQVRSLWAYIKRLNQRCKSFFRLSKNDPKDRIYYNGDLGHNYLDSMMKKISTVAKLSVCYSNHSLTVTTVHVLDVAQFPNRHIMFVTGHKSGYLLKTYTGQTSKVTKKHVSDT
ncbi:unnamed protein product [Mytilus coruscus]|uniref:Uncharacterized protein n=1 Tax=Mytilus coruscus TaxID=42192 RepID=A0A6J8CLC3_MYTCO|nr:unnamed protein product [Mytilus coruscus]